MERKFQITSSKMLIYGRKCLSGHSGLSALDLGGLTLEVTDLKYKENEMLCLFWILFEILSETNTKNWLMEMNTGMISQCGLIVRLSCGGRMLWYDTALEYQCNSSHPLTKIITLWMNQKSKRLFLWRVDWETSHIRRMAEYCYVRMPWPVRTYCKKKDMWNRKFIPKINKNINNK